MSPHTSYNLGPGPGGYPAAGGLYPVPVAPPKRRHTGLIVLAVLLAVALCGGGGLLAVLAVAPSTKDGYQAAQDNTPAGPTGAGAAHATSAGAPAPAPPTKAKTTIDDGTWTAGVDFTPGKYEVTATAKLCTWQVYTGEQPNVTYVDPGHIGPGHYVFTFKTGQHLLTQGCGTWVKVG